MSLLVTKEKKVGQEKGNIIATYEILARKVWSILKNYPTISEFLDDTPFIVYRRGVKSLLKNRGHGFNIKLRVPLDVTAVKLGDTFGL